MKTGKRLLLLLAATLVLAAACTVISFADDPVPAAAKDQDPVTNVPYFNQGLVVQGWTYGDDAANRYSLNTDYTACVLHENCSAFISYPWNFQNNHPGYEYVGETSDPDERGDYYDSTWNNPPYYYYDKYECAYHDVHFYYTNDSAIQYAKVDDDFVVDEDTDLNEVTGWSAEVPEDAGKYVARVWFHKKTEDPSCDEGAWSYCDKVDIPDKLTLYYENMHEADDPENNTFGAVKYEDHYEYALFTIEPRTITGVKWMEEDDDGNISFEYNGKAQQPTAYATGVIGKDICEIKDLTISAKEGSELEDNAAVNVGTYTAEVVKPTGETTGSSLSNPNYIFPEGDLENVSHDFTITAKELTLKWPDKNEFVYNGEDQQQKAEAEEIDGVCDKDKETIAPDKLTYTLTKRGQSRKDAITVGDYKVTAALPEDCKNYTIPEDNAVFTFSILQLEAEFVWDGLTVIYNGEEQVPEVTVSNAAEGDEVTARVGTRESECIDAGTYAARIIALGGEDARNYSLPENATANFTILPQPVSIDWDETTFEYDGKAQAPEAEAVDLDGKTLTSADVTIEISGDENLRWTKSGGIDVNVTGQHHRYTATAAELKDSNGNVLTNYTLLNDDTKPLYEGLRYNGQRISRTALMDTYSTRFSITPLAAELSWKNTDLTYNGAEQAPTAVITNLKKVAGKPVDDCTVVVEGAKTNAGDAYEAEAVELTGAQASNYTLQATEKTDFNIRKCALTVTANPNSISYGDAPADAGVTAAVLQGKDTFESIGLKVKYSYDYAKNGKPGVYTITPSGNAETENYKVTYAAGKLTVSDKATQVVAKAVSKGRKSLKFTWSEVNGAAAYELYFGPCNVNGKSSKVKKITTLKGSPLKYTKKKLKANTAYKFYVVAKDSKGKIISRSVTGHVFTNKYKGKYTNAKSIKVNADKVSVNKNGTFKLSASYKKAKKGKTLAAKGHAAKTRYVSENPAVAAVAADGTITGVSAGWCRVYAQGVDGIWKAVEVTVK